MKNALEKLLALVPPPAEPADVPDADDWRKAEKYLGTKLPADFKEFVGHYGSGTFCDFYVVFNPRASSKGPNLIDQFNELDAYDERHRENPARFPYGMFPDKPGLLPWGSDTNGNRYFWLVKPKAKPDAWAVVWDAGGEGLEAGDVGFGEYLLGILEGRIDPLASNYPQPSDFKFEPARAEAEAVNPGDELCEAIGKGDEKRVRELLDRGVRANSRGGDPESGRTALGCALLAKSAPIVRLLLERGADVKALDNGYAPLLSVAVSSGDPAMARLMLDAGADVNDSGTAATTPLSEAVRRQDHEVVRLLLEAGANPNAPEQVKGRPPLFQAIWNGNDDLVQLLLEHGADPGAKDDEGVTAVEYARSQGRASTEGIMQKARARQ